MKEQEHRFSYHQLCGAVAQAIVDAGVPAESAKIEAEIMVEADLQEVPSHGVRMLPGLLRGLADGRVNRSADVRLSHEFAAVCRLDGDNGPGRALSRQAMEQADGGQFKQAQATLRETLQQLAGLAWRRFGRRQAPH